MLQFLVVAYDGMDAGALERRMAARAAHQASVKPLEERGAIVAGGPMLNAEGKPCGTVCIATVADRAELDAWLEHDPYRTQGVWQRVEVTPMLVVFPKL